MLRKKAILLIHGFAGGAYDYGNLPNDLNLLIITRYLLILYLVMIKLLLIKLLKMIG